MDAVYELNIVANPEAGDRLQVAKLNLNAYYL